MKPARRKMTAAMQTATTAAGAFGMVPDTTSFRTLTSSYAAANDPSC